MNEVATLDLMRAVVPDLIILVLGESDPCEPICRAHTVSSAGLVGGGRPLHPAR
jgi:hypothetical protein